MGLNWELKIEYSGNGANCDVMETIWFGTGSTWLINQWFVNRIEKRIIEDNKDLELFECCNYYRLGMCDLKDFIKDINTAIKSKEKAPELFPLHEKYDKDFFDELRWMKSEIKDVIKRANQIMKEHGTKDYQDECFFYTASW